MMKLRGLVSLCALTLLCCAEKDAVTLEREAHERAFAEKVARNFETLKSTKA